MKHINLTSWKGTLTNWVELNYLNGGIADYYADIANIKGNYLRNSKNLCSTASYSGIMNNSEAYTVSLGALSEGTYTLSVNVETTVDRYLTIFWFKEGSQVSSYNDTSLDNTRLNTTGTKYITFTIDDSVEFDNIRLGINTGTTNYSPSINNIMLVKESAPTTYEPYGSLVIEKNWDRAIPNLTNWQLRTRDDINIFSANVDVTYKKENDIIVRMEGYTANNSVGAWYAAADFGDGVITAYNGQANYIVYWTNNNYNDVVPFFNSIANKYLEYKLATPEIIVIPDFSGELDITKYFPYHTYTQNGGATITLSPQNVVINGTVDSTVQIIPLIQPVTIPNDVSIHLTNTTFTSNHYLNIYFYNGNTRVSGFSLFPEGRDITYPSSHALVGKTVDGVIFITGKQDLSSITVTGDIDINVIAEE